jgi:S-DNA-T family DNA segregation ATPase FtsK/SpoIIIE
VHEWVHGFHGVHVQAAAHHAHTATREARALARRARYTVMPKQRAAALVLADRAQTAAQAAVAAHKQARAEVRTGRLRRAAVAFGGPLIADMLALAELGWFGLLLGLGSNGAALAVLGRRDPAESTWDETRRTLGDGDPLTESMLDRAFVAAGIIREGQRLCLVSPPVMDGTSGEAWSVLVDLPDTTVDKARSKQVELAAALGIDRSQLDLRQEGGEGRLHLWASMGEPFAASRTSPLVERTEPVNTWRDGIPIGFDKRGRIIYVTVSDYSMLFGGVTRSGKGMALANFLAGALLDSRVRVRLFDGKGSGEYVPLAPVLATFVRKNPARLDAFLDVMMAELDRRTEVLVERGVSKADETLLDELGGIELIVIDELATYTAPDGQSAAYADRIAEKLAQLAAVGAACGILLGLATQFPLADIVPTRLRGNCGGRLACRVDTPTGSNTILGDGMVGQGYDASKIPNLKSSRGRGWLTTPDTGVIEIRSLFIDESKGELWKVAATGTILREDAGTLPGRCADPVEAELLRVTGASSIAGGRKGNGGIIRVTVLDDLADAATRLGRGGITRAEAFAVLADVDPDRYGRTAGESDAAYASRVGKAFAKQLAELGAHLPEGTALLTDGKVVDAAGIRTNGYTLTALTDAAEQARTAPIPAA